MDDRWSHRLKTSLEAMLLCFLRIVNLVIVRLFEIVFGNFINFSLTDFIWETFFFFLEKQTHTHTREKEKGSNTKAHHRLHSKVMVYLRDLIVNYFLDSLIYYKWIQLCSCYIIWILVLLTSRVSKILVMGLGCHSYGIKVCPNQKCGPTLEDACTRK